MERDEDDNRSLALVLALGDQTDYTNPRKRRKTKPTKSTPIPKTKFDIGSAITNGGETKPTNNNLPQSQRADPPGPKLLEIAQKKGKETSHLIVKEDAQTNSPDNPTSNQADLDLSVMLSKIQLRD